MKKHYLTFILLAFVTLISCSKDDTSGGAEGIRPPEWIQGTWLFDNTYGGSSQGFRFTSNNLITILQGTEISQREQMKFYIDAGEEASAKDTSGDNFYEFRLNYPAGQSVIYSFEKVGETAIVWEQIGAVEYVKQ